MNANLLELLDLLAEREREEAENGSIEEAEETPETWASLPPPSLARSSTAGVSAP